MLRHKAEQTALSKKPESAKDALSRRFEAAAALVAREGRMPGAARAADMPKEDKLRLYGLYKQVKFGDAPATGPFVFDFVQREKWLAWREQAGRDPVLCKQEYVRIVERAQGSSFS